MDRIHAQQETNWVMVALPVLVDGVTAVALILLLPGLARRLLQPGGWNAALVVVAYIFFCIGVYLIRKLLPQALEGSLRPPEWLMDRRVRGVLAVLFGLLMMSTLAYQLGYFAALDEAALRTMGEGDSSAFLVYGPGAWLGFSMLVILVLAFPVNASVPPETPRYVLLAGLGLLACNGMLLVVTAQARAMVEMLGRVGGITAVLAVFVALLLSFGPARLIYHDRQPHPSGLVSFALLLLLATTLAAL